MNHESPWLCGLGIVSALGSGPQAHVSGLADSRIGLVREAIAGRDFWIGRAGFARESLSIASGTRPDPLAPEGNRVCGLLAEASDQIADLAGKAAGRYGPSRIAVLVGSTDNGAEQSRAAVSEYLASGFFPENYSLAMQAPQLPAAFVARRLGLRGMTAGISTACASGATAIARARELIESGLCDAVIAGGADIVSDSVALGFQALEAVSPEPCNPFSRNRRGISLGEGAALFVLCREPLDGPCPRLLGAGESCDAYHLTAPEPSGEGAAAAMAMALADSGVAARDIGYLNLHGTGTMLNDSMEALAVSKVLGLDTPLSSTKPLMGHCLGAAGAIELGLCWLALRHGGVLPPHLWDGQADPGLPALRFVGSGESAEGLRLCMSNSFAFGGVNVSLILGASI